MLLFLVKICLQFCAKTHFLKHLVPQTAQLPILDSNDIVYGHPADHVIANIIYGRGPVLP